MIERREFVRFSCKMEVESKIGKNWFVLQSKNISLDGIMLTCRSDIEKLKKSSIGTEKEVLLSFYLPDQRGAVKVSGRIVHMERKKNPTDGTEASIIGIKFIDVSDQTNEQLKKFILGKGNKPII